MKKNDNMLDHDVIHDDDKKRNKDHYHGIHHFTKKGHHDDINDDEFLIKNNLKIHSRQELIYKISASGIILSLAILLTFVDSWLEIILRPAFKGVTVPIRVLDVLIVFLAVPITGPIFGGIIGFSIPWFHLLVHSDHNPIQMIPDSFAYLLTVWLFWLIFYGIFKNSAYHRDPDPKKDVFKRWAPIIPIVLVSAFVFIVAVILAMYIYDVSIKKEPEPFCCHQGLKEFLISSKYNVIVLVVVEIIRFLILYVLFALLEPRLKMLNHRYR